MRSLCTIALVASLGTLAGCVNVAVLAEIPDAAGESHDVVEGHDAIEDRGWEHGEDAELRDGEFRHEDAFDKDH
jgi:hypothetical protein